jgi:hypothetical protein
MQNHVHGTPASQVEELGWGEHRTPAAAVYSANNAFINGLHGIMQFDSVRKTAMYFLHENSPIVQAFPLHHAPNLKLFEELCSSI